MVSRRQNILLRILIAIGLIAGATAQTTNPIGAAIWTAVILTLPAYALMARYNGEKMFPRIRRRLHKQIE